MHIFSPVLCYGPLLIGKLSDYIFSITQVLEIFKQKKREEEFLSFFLLFYASLGDASSLGIQRFKTAATKKVTATQLLAKIF